MTIDYEAVWRRLLGENFARGKEGAIKALREAFNAELAEVRVENERLKAAMQRQAAAVRTLHANEETEINRLRKGRNDAHRANATLDSEREMNAILTAELDDRDRTISERDAVIERWKQLHAENCKAYDAACADREWFRARAKP